MATSKSDYYVPKKRQLHSTHIVGDYLYMWGGNIDGLPRVHDNEVKQRMISVIQLFHLPTGWWEQRPTNGKPPLGVIGYASTVISNRIYYFGGYCNHGQCRHNSLNSLTTDSLTWNELFPTNPSMGPMMKSHCGMVSLTFNEVDYLLVVGGFGPRPTSPQSGGQCSVSIYGGNVRTNEHHYYQLSSGKGDQYIMLSNTLYIKYNFITLCISGQWILPEISGECPPPCSSFTLTSLPNNRALLFGGNTPNGSINTVYIAQCTKTAVHWEKISEPLPKSANWPQSRYDHATTIISDLHVMMVGGYTDTTADSWLFNVDTKTWTKLNIPESVTMRWSHSLSLWNVSPTTVWIIQFGGYCNGKLNDTTVIELICNDDQWTVGDVITNLTSTEEYQLKLRQKRREISVQPSRRHGQPQLTVQAVRRRPSFRHQKLQDKDREIQRLTQQLEVTNKELQDTKQQQIDMTRTLEENLQIKERQLQQLQQELQIRNQFVIELQQTQAILQHELEDSLERESSLQEGFETNERQLLQLHTEFQEKQQTQATLEREHKNRERLLQEKLQDSEERERALRQEHDDLRRKHDDYRQQHDNIEQDLHEQLQESTSCLQQAQHTISTLQQQVQQLQQQSHWVVRKEEIEITEEILGKGGWGEVKVAKFRGLRVAAKYLHEVILSPYNISVFTREMEIAAQVRHPNLLQFIGATKVGSPIILSELMPTSLRKEIEKSPLTRPQIIKIAQDISAALNYLHLWQPHPILHRDVSSPNVLLEPSGHEMWKAKLSDFGSANLVQSVSANSIAPGNPFYSAPEAPFPDQHSPAMDVFSFGVLLMEMILCQPPAAKTAEKITQSKTIQWPAMKCLIQRCISHESQVRPSIAQVLTDIEHM